MKIQLLLPAGEIHRNGTGIFKRELRYAPLTLTTLAALIPHDLNVEVVPANILEHQDLRQRGFRLKRFLRRPLC